MKREAPRRGQEETTIHSRVQGLRGAGGVAGARQRAGGELQPNWVSARKRQFAGRRAKAGGGRGRRPFRSPPRHPPPEYRHPEPGGPEAGAGRPEGAVAPTGPHARRPSSPPDPGGTGREPPEAGRGARSTRRHGRGRTNLAAQPAGRPRMERGGGSPVSALLHVIVLLRFTPRPRGERPSLTPGPVPLARIRSGAGLRKSSGSGSCGPSTRAPSARGRGAPPSGRWP